MLVVKNPPANAEVRRDAGSISGSGRSPGGRVWQLTPVFLPGESYGQRSLGGYSPWGLKESDMAEQLSTHILIKYNLHAWFGPWATPNKNTVHKTGCGLRIHRLSEHPAIKAGSPPFKCTFQLLNSQSWQLLFSCLVVSDSLWPHGL